MRKKVMIDADRLASITEQLSTTIPADILEAKEVLKQKESIINMTQLEARRIREEATEEAEAIVSSARQEQESKIGEAAILRIAEQKAEEKNKYAEMETQQILQEAQRKAYRILQEAEKIAAERREGANQYAREMLFDLEERLSAQLGQVRRGIDSLGIEIETTVPA